MTDTTVVAGDVHLGAANANVNAFESFLDGLLAGSVRADRLVLVGDVWDLVRRDPFGCAWETSETVTRIKRLADAIPVHLVFGNHDAHLRGLDETLYDVQLHDQLVVESGDVTVRLRHGNAFDRLQSDRLSAYLSGPGDRGNLDPTRGAKDPVVAEGRRLFQAGKRSVRTLLGDGGRDAVAFPRRERRAHAALDAIPEDKLVFGHTHAPYVHPENTVANPGSWKSTAPVHDTYLTVTDGQITLYRHRLDGDDELVDPPVGPGEGSLRSDR